MGPAGVGKTVLARAAASSFARQHPKAVSHWISATASASRVPFGAFSHLVELKGAGEPATSSTRRELRCVRRAPGAFWWQWTTRTSWTICPRR
jgi:hypothetical protein